MRFIKIFFSISIILCVFPSLSILSEEDNDKEIKQVIDELIDVKSIEQEIVFGYPIEDARLMDDLIYGRNIEYVIEFFEKYYEEEVVEQYLYYLKRSKQKFYYEIGVFWGDNFKVVGNVFKREAMSIDYDIEYVSIEYNDDVVNVVTRVTPIYYGEYMVRGEESKEFKEETIEMIFNLRKNSAGEWKYTQLSDTTIEMMEEEIEQEINLNEKEKVKIYSEVKNLEGINQYKIEDINLIYDALKRISNGGLEELYDQYNQVWLLNSLHKVMDVDDNFSLDNLKENYKGWEYAYVYYESINDNIGYMLAFNINDGDIVSMSSIPYFDNQDLIEKKEAKKIIEPFVDPLNKEMNIFLGSAGGYQNSWTEINEYMAAYYNETWSETMYWWDNIGSPMIWDVRSFLVYRLLDHPRRVDTGRMNYWMVEDGTNNYTLILPPGRQLVQPYNNFEVLEVAKEQDPVRANGDLEVIIETHYFYDCINLFYYAQEEIVLERDNYNNGGLQGEWSLGYSSKFKKMWDRIR